MAASKKSGVVTLLHTACGAGILAMPYGFRPFGWFPGIFILTLCGLCSTIGLLLQARVAQYAKNQNASFFSLAQLINPNLSIMFDLAIAIKCFGVGISYIIVVGDLIPLILFIFTRNSLLLDRNFNITLIMVFVIAPLCFMKRLNSLRYASMVAMSSVAYLCVLVLFHFLFPSDDIKNLKGSVSYGFPTGEPSPLTTLPIFIFAYTCHHNMFSVINEQKDNSFKNVKYIAMSSMLLAYILYFLIGSAGYLTFGDNIVGNVITLYPISLSSTIGRVAIVLLVTFAFPLQCHPARASIHHIIHYWEQARKTVDIEEDNTIDLESRELIVAEEETLLAEELVVEESVQEPQVVPLTGRRFVIITTCILVASYLVAILVSELARVLSVVGATGSTSISFILPGTFGYKLIGSEHNGDSNEESLSKFDKFLKYAALGLIIWGIFVMITSLSATLFLGASH
ncbi:similar to Saccharomyces cerevisiae YER119C AVT6 Vacuolar aspartate and glutamate exporter [Maudiozyma saulgeensis]|uniref:Similar to Saccharomyces cerevisiae YER119C AVT6 Vacuolar aspartate and glutamate exporter n=1 Tax=Maudiozyma saulgeensis TaxID=1789683 RepID=A0A1X7R6R6_9SACH|nr:similar to Saccharomyces cerevisiae YER119C AVT6 Vacuolar aspartate and glutamate exporter [Kazachstania saulgeensis]